MRSVVSKSECYAKHSTLLSASVSDLLNICNFYIEVNMKCFCLLILLNRDALLMVKVVNIHYQKCYLMLMKFPGVSLLIVIKVSFMLV